MKIHTAEFVISAPTVGKCPAADRPEYAFIGRSNVGKSSLINMLTGRKGLAKTSSMPGKTLLINHFLINESWYLVDLPGYGYARRSKAQQEELTRMIKSYVCKRENLTCLFLLIDSRHKPQNIDLEFIRFLGENGIPFAIVFTKADKNRSGELKRNVKGFLDKMSEEWEELPPHFVTSSAHSDGREELLDYIDEVNRSLN